MVEFVSLALWVCFLVVAISLSILAIVMIVLTGIAMVDYWVHPERYGGWW